MVSEGKYRRHNSLGEAEGGAVIEKLSFPHFPLVLSSDNFF